MMSAPDRPTQRVAAAGPDVGTDPRRAAAVQRLLDAGGQSAALDAIVALAARLLGAASAQVSLLAEQQIVVAGVGSAVPLPRPSAKGDSLCSVMLRSGAPLVVPDARHNPDVEGLPPVVHGVVGAYLGVPLVVSGVGVGALCVYDPLPRNWTADHTATLTTLAGAAAAELELRALASDLELSSTRLSVALWAASIGSFQLNPDTGELLWDDRLLEMFEYDRHSFRPDISSFTSRLHPDDQDRVAEAMAACIASDGELALEYRIVAPSGGVRWITARGRMVAVDSDGVRMMGAAFDSTVARDNRDRVSRLLESMTDAFFSVDHDWNVTYVNSHGEQVLGRTRADLLGRNIWAEFPDATDTEFSRAYRRAVQTGEPVAFEEYYPAPLDKWFEVRAWPTSDGLSVFFHDVTARRKVELDRERAYAEAEAAKDRLAVLGEITGALSSTLEVDVAMDRLVRLVVPHLATWAAVTLVDEAGGLRECVARHADPARAADMAGLGPLQTRLANEQSLTRTVARTGRPALRATISPQQLRHGWATEEFTELIERLGLATLIVVPLQVRDRTLGVLVLAGGPDRSPFTESDLSVAVEIGRRAGLSLENAKLYGRQRSAAETLQRHLLPALPEPDHLEMRARYRPAAQEAQVGGDFYWGTVQQPGGATVVAIGDVSGHDLEAISWQAQLAPLLRGFAFEGRDGPAAVLTRVDRAMRGLQIDTMATAVLARIEQSDAAAGTDPRGLWKLLWSNAGHPPPMLLRAGGQVETLEVEPDLLLGLDPDTGRSEHSVMLRPNDTLLLYTDGLIERRDSSIEQGLTRLRQALSSAGGTTVEQLCDQVLSRMLTSEPDDDVALLAVRAHPQDRPRPPEAGPEIAPPEAGPEIAPPEAG